MNKFTISIVVIFLLILVILIYGSESSDDSNKQILVNEELKIDLIRPPEIVKPNEDIKNTQDKNIMNLSVSTKDNNKIKRLTKLDKRERKEELEYPFTEEGQSFKTLGELLLENHEHDDTTQFSANLLKQMEQAKYNLKLAKEIASMSKKLYIDTDDGKKMDQDVYEEINKLSKNLIVELKRQQNVK